MNKDLQNRAIQIFTNHLAYKSAKPWNKNLARATVHFAKMSRKTRNAAAPGLRRARRAKIATEFLVRIASSATPVDVHTVEAALASGANPEERDNRGRTLLMMAAAKGHDAIVQQLIAAGVKVNTRTRSGWTALMYAVDGGHDDVVQRLLAAGAKVNTGANTRSLLMMAAARGHDAVVQRLLAAKVNNVNGRTPNGWTALTYAADGGHDDVVQRLLAAGAKVDARDQSKVNTRGNIRTPLMAAASRGHDVVVQRLLAAGAKVDRRDQSGETALIIAAARGHDGMVRRLLAAAER
jgi:ankyrin repeat protein